MNIIVPNMAMTFDHGCRWIKEAETRGEYAGGGPSASSAGYGIGQYRSNLVCTLASPSLGSCP